ncbi:MAG TPA: zinc-binding dehydrogenase [Solirubrobacteraceae bacterium]|nr:zinc-binding dehydrogenase [Solirubrobacteraceae bacterium]
MRWIGTTRSPAAIASASWARVAALAAAAPPSPLTPYFSIEGKSTTVSMRSVAMGWRRPGPRDLPRDLSQRRGLGPRRRGRGGRRGRQGRSGWRRGDRLHRQPASHADVKGDGGAAAASAATLAQLAEAIAAGDLVVPIQRTYPLDDVRAAFTELEAGHIAGKIVLIP